MSEKKLKWDDIPQTNKKTNILQRTFFSLKIKVSKVHNACIFLDSSIRNKSSRATKQEHHML